jgi:hypothetical protein
VKLERLNVQDSCSFYWKSSKEALPLLASQIVHTSGPTWLGLLQVDLIWDWHSHSPFQPSYLSQHLQYFFSLGLCQEQSLRSLWGHKHSGTQYSAGWVWHSPSCRRGWEYDVQQLLFLRCLCQIICRLRFGTASATEESKKARCSSAAFPKLFTFREVRTQVSSVTMSCPSPRTVALPPCLPPDIKDSLKKDRRFLWWGFF